MLTRFRFDHADQQMKKALHVSNRHKRYSVVTEEKAEGAVYTPELLANFVANQIVHAAGKLPEDRPVQIFDPAVGHGSLIHSLLGRLMAKRPELKVEVHGFETNRSAIDVAQMRLNRDYPDVRLNFSSNSFLDFVAARLGEDAANAATCSSMPVAYDLIIANPPYVRTQVMGSKQAQVVAKQFGLNGRVDLYYAFTLGIVQVLKPKGIAGIIVSNRFMTTKSGASLRSSLMDKINLQHVWDLGDTRFFDAAVLPAVLVFKHKGVDRESSPSFTTIYETTELATGKAKDPIKALDKTGVVQIEDGRRFQVRHGKLNTSGKTDDVWRIATKEVDEWLKRVAIHSWGTFGDIGKVRVGVKTCADKVFIRSDWQKMPASTRPELLKPVTTHHVARQFKPRSSGLAKEILYPHESVFGQRRAVDLDFYPNSRTYLESHRDVLQSRQYVTEVGRNWYEIWVPQDPEIWKQDKLVFRDIAEEPTFWVDLDGSVVNGDCYWLASGEPDLLWLAVAVGNSKFIKQFYDFRFHNKLYAGRRRFMTQYVELFPLPDPNGPIGKVIIDKAKQIYDLMPGSAIDDIRNDLDNLVWEALTGAPYCQDSCQSENGWQLRY